MRDADSKLCPDDLYCGRTFLEGRKAANCLDAEFFVSYLKSAAYQGHNPLTAIQIALKGNAVNLIPA